jgi:hypothetical protein
MSTGSMSARSDSTTSAEERIGDEERIERR